MRRLLPAGVLTLLVATGCGGADASVLTLGDGAAGRSWGDGPYGLVLVPDAGHDAASWEEAARTFADDGMTVVAVEAPEAAAVVAALRHLLEGRSLERAALLGAGEGASTAIKVALAEPQLVDQLIVLSAAADVSRLGPFPKLFVASQGEAAAADAERMAAEAPGEWNDLYVAAGDASGQEILDGEGAEGAMEAIGRRLQERR